MLVGALVAVMPLLGFPVSWQMWIFFILGIVVIALGIAVRRRGSALPEPRRRKGEFVESVPRPLVGEIAQRVSRRSEDDNDIG